MLSFVYASINAHPYYSLYKNPTTKIYVCIATCKILERVKRFTFMSNVKIYYNHLDER